MIVVKKYSTIFVAILFFFMVLNATINAADKPEDKKEDIQNFFLDGNLHLGTLMPFGVEKKSGATIGGNTTLRFESDGRAVLVLGELAGEGFSNDPEGQNVKLSRFMLNASLAVGNKSVKWLTPLNIALDREPALNEEIGFRYAFSGLYLRPINDAGKNPGQLRQVAEMVFNIVYESFSYGQTGIPSNKPENLGCAPEDYECINSRTNGAAYQYVGTRDFIALYSKLKYELQKNNLGGSFELVLTQPVAFKTYTRADAATTGFYQLQNDFSNLRLFVGVNGSIEHDTVDPTQNALEGALRIFGGVGGRF